MEILHATRGELADYVTRQLAHFFPDAHTNQNGAVVAKSLATALQRMEKPVAVAKLWPLGKFSHLHSNQYAVFLYFLANSIWREQQNEVVASKLFSLNKSLHGLEIFYAIELPDIFYIPHSPGIVLSRAHYADYFVLYQNTTVGRVQPDLLPRFEPGVVLYPNSVVIGNCHIRANSFIAQGQAVIDADTPGDCVVFNHNGKLIFKPPSFDILSYFFKI
jgi:serine O-acetyltransferase